MHRIDPRRLALWVLLLTLTFPIATQAQAEDGLQVTLTPDRAALAVGDPVQLLLEVKHPTGYQVIVPRLDPMWGDFEVRSQSQLATVANDDGTETTQQTIEVTLFALGDFQTPELPLTIRTGDGRIIEESVPPALLSVEPTRAEEDMELRDIKPQASLALPPLWPAAAGGVLVAALVAMGGWWAYRRWQGKPMGLAPAVDNRPPWQVAYDELARIEGMGLLDQGRVKAYYTLVTDCLRLYLQDQFHLRVFDRTTTELKSVLGQSDLAPEHGRRLLSLFVESDLVKFAKFVPDMDQALQATVEARSLVEATRPRQDLETATGDRPPATTQPPHRLSYQSGQ